MNVCYLNEKDEIVVSASGKVLTEPAISYLPKDELLLAFGNYNTVINEAKHYNESVSFSDSSTAYTICFGTTRPDITCYIINRMFQSPLCEFISEFHQKNRTGNLFPWIEKEMEYVPINIHDKGN